MFNKSGYVKIVVMSIGKSKIFIGFIFLIGIFLRFIVFGVNNCYIHDDAALAINVVNKSYLEFFGGLENCQVAPPLFLILSKSIYNILPKDYQIIDFCLKFLPFISAIISIPLFYILSNLFFKEKFKLYIANILFALNPMLICLSGRFKQYSTEVAIAIILYIIFYKYLYEGKWKKYWYFIIFLAPWLSLSSLIVLFSGIIIIYLKNKQIDKKILSVLLGSILLFLAVYLPSNLQKNYIEMNSFWSRFGFMSVTHPQRFFIRLGEIFEREQKILKTVLGIFIFLKMLVYTIKNKQFNSMILVIVPILITVLLSCFHIYPFMERLIAFLVPLFIILISEHSNSTISKFVAVSCVLISLFGAFMSISYVQNLPNYRNEPIKYLLLNEDEIHKDYIPFITVYRWYTHLE